MPRLDAADECRQYEQAKTDRSQYENDWRMSAAYCLPGDYRSWQGFLAPPGTLAQRAETVRYAFDNTGAKALPKYAAILQRLITPAGSIWCTLRPTDPNLRKRYAVREYFNRLNELMFEKRYSPRARFVQTTAEAYTSLGVYGNAPYIVKRRKKYIGGGPGLQYTSIPFKDVFYITDADGNIVGFWRRFWMNARQFQTEWPDAEMPKKLRNERDKPGGPSESVYAEFFQVVRLKHESEYDPQALDNRRHPYRSCYVCVDEKQYVGPEEGFQSLPMITPRVATTAGSPYGYAPALLALPALGSVNQMKRTVLKQGQKAVDPVIFTHDDQSYNGRVSQVPGTVNPGFVNKQGQALFATLPVGNFNVAEQLLVDERQDINDAFFVTLFQILTETPEMTATEVLERVAEKAALLAPTMGRLQAEHAGPLIEREIAVLSELGMLPEMPPELIEARGEYTVEYTSPLAKSMYAEEVAGYMRVVEMALNIASATQDPSHLDHFEFDVSLPEIADRVASPTRWMASPEQLARKRENRQNQQTTQTVVDAAPAIASVVNASRRKAG